MNKITKLIIAFGFVFLGISNGVQAQYVVDSDYSVVHFSTIKKNYVVEPAVISNITGGISDSGKANIQIDLNSIDTRVPIRNERLNKLFFESVKFPNTVVSAKIDIKKEMFGVSDFKKMQVPATLSLFGTSKEIFLNVLIAKVGKDKLLITSLSPTIINADDFGIPASNLANLAATVGGIKISNKVGVSFVLSLKPK
jgi:polyisoprenoid-binding protein YceI